MLLKRSGDAIGTASLRRRAERTQVPQFSLYGETDTPDPQRLHIEDIQERSRLYSWDISPHRHGGLYQLVLVLAGPVEIAMDELRHAPGEPVAVIIPPGAVHAFHFSAQTEGYVLTLNTNWTREAELELDEVCRSLFAAPRLLFLGANEGGHAGVDNLMRELMREFRQPDGPTSPVTGWLARAIIWRLARGAIGERGNAGKNPQDASYLRFRLLLEKHYLEHWSVVQYAEALSLTVERLNRLCKQQANLTASELIQQRVVQEACRRLIYVVVPVAQLAYELGFADAAYFCRFFKRHTGLSPNQYRKHHSGYELNDSIVVAHTPNE